MDQHSKKLIQSLKDMKLTIDQNDEKIWSCNASSKCYKGATEKLRNKNELIKQELERTDKEIKELEPQIKILEAIYTTNYDMFKVSFQAISQLLSYNSCLKGKIASMKQENEHVLEQHKKHYDSVKSNLEEGSVKYKIKKEKEIELKRIKFRVMMLQAKLRQRKQINQQKKEIRKRMFHNFWIKFAKAWLDNKKYNEGVQKLQEVAAKEKEVMQKYFESCERLKKAQKLAALRKKELQSSNMNKENENNVQRCKINSLDGFVRLQAQLHPFGSLKYALDSLEHHGKTVLLKEPTAGSSKDVSSQEPNASKNVSTKTEFNKPHSKVRIIENTVVPRTPLTGKTKVDRNKLQKVVDNFNKRLQKFKSNKSQVKLNESLNNSIQSETSPLQVAAIDSKMDTEPVIVATGASQPMENLNICSQENPKQNNNFKQKSQQQTIAPSQNTVEPMEESPQLSQPLSQTLVQGKLLNEPRGRDNFAKPKGRDEIQKGNQHTIQKKISDMKFLPQATKVGQDQIRQKCSDVKNDGTNNFAAVPKNFSGYRESFNVFGNPHNKDTFSSSHAVSAVAQNSASTMPPPLPAKHNAQFSVESDGFQTKNIEVPNQNLMEFGETQYNFGNITAFSNPNTDKGYDGGYLSPEITPNFSNNNENVGFSFGAPAQSLFSLGEAPQTNNQFRFKF